MIKCELNDLFSLSHFVWVADDAPMRNQFVRFVREFEWEGGDAEIHLFADTRYRLRVNGSVASNGPARFVTQYPEYDSCDLTPLLRRGWNRVEVEVNFFGASSFQSMPDGRPGFIAAGRAGRTDFATPGEWTAERMTAWRSDAPLYSFAQNPVEICDTRLLPVGKKVPLRILEGEEKPWRVLAPYSGSPLARDYQRPSRIELAGALRQDEIRLGFVSCDPDFANRNEKKDDDRLWTGFRTWIFSPRDQIVRLSCFWSDLWCNGEPISIDQETELGNHAYCFLNLKAGWNHLVGKLCVLAEHWTYCLGIPKDAGVSLHAQRDVHAREVFMVSPPQPREHLCLPGEEDDALPSGWRFSDGDPSLLTPARMMAWDQPAPDAMRGLEIGSLPEVSRIDAPEATWAFSFEGEFLGYPELDVEAPAGTLLDVAYDDWQSAHGGVALYQSNPFTDAADRFVLLGGRQRIELFHPRGGKLMQVTLRAPRGIAVPLSLHSLSVRSRQSIRADSTSFDCNLDSFNWLWPTAMRTLICSTDESYTDCPWRERACYIGDAYVNIHLNLLLNSDPRTARRVLRIFGQAQLPDGQLPGCAPSWLRKPHEDYTLLWIQALHDYWSLTGDLDLVEELWPVHRKIWESPTWEAHPSGLWNATRTRLFVDWGILKSEREGEANATLNLFRYGSLKASAAMAKALARESEAAAFQESARQLEDAIFKVLWSDSEGRLRASLEAQSPAVHANILALAYELGERPQRAAILSYLEPKLRQNLSKGLSAGQYSGHLELYFFHYALPALARHERPDLAEHLINDHYGYLRRLGDDTLPECFCRVEKSVGSRCHSWSGAAAIYAARYVLGIRPLEPGNPDELLFAPTVSGVTHASGRISHPKGWIEVKWSTDEDGALLTDIHVPEGVKLTKLEKRSQLKLITG